MQEATEEPTEAPKSRGGLLMLAALALIAVPVIVGLIVIRSDSPSSRAATETDMGGGMGDTGTTSAPAGGVLAFSDIQATDISIEPDPAGGAAVLRVDTTIDVACAVAFGPTEALGSLATDTDMAGGGHSAHQPLLRDLTPGTTYFYRIAAIASNGALYQSDLLQFTYTGESIEAIEPPARNVAVGADVTAVSSEFSDAFAATNAVDGSTSSEWSSAGDGDNAFIEIDLGDPYAVLGVGFRTRSMTDGTSITTSFTVTVDGGETYGPFEAGPGLSVALVEFEGQVLRFDVVTSTGGNTGAIEVEVYGSIVTGDNDGDM
jgi:hypothetical protein